MWYIVYFRVSVGWLQFKIVCKDFLDFSSHEKLNMDKKLSKIVKIPAFIDNSTFEFGYFKFYFVG